MSETNLWTAMRGGMKGRWKCAQRHEDKFDTGVPDVSFCLDNRCGWVELKHIPMWPARESTVVACEHFTVGQRQKISRLDRYGGGMGFVFLQVDRDYLLFSGQVGAEVVGRWARQGLFDNVLGHWQHRCLWSELAGIIAERGLANSA